MALPMAAVRRETRSLPEGQSFAAVLMGRGPVAWIRPEPFAVREAQVAERQARFVRRGSG